MESPKPSATTTDPPAQDPAELLAVVDQLDNEVGAERRDTVHRLGLLHRAVHVIVTGPGGGIILQQRSSQKDTFPLHWECVGGHLGPGEAYAGAAEREVLEELGAAPLDLRRLLKHGPTVETGNEFIEVWTARITTAPAPNPAEIAAIEERPWSEWQVKIQRWLHAAALSSPRAKDAARRAIAPGPLASFRAIGWLPEPDAPADPATAGSAQLRQNAPIR